MLTVDHVHKHYDGSHVLKGISLAVPQGQSILFRGDNGSGKSTLLRIICGLLRPTSGQVKWALGFEKEEQRTIGYVPERFPQLNMTPFEYLMAMGRIQGMSDREIKGRMEELMALFRMESYMNQRMNSFSKGMLQKVNLVQAMLSKPDLLILDEPLSGLDIDAQEKLLQRLLELNSEGTALMMVCHESDLLDCVAERIITLERGELVGDELVELSNGERVKRYKLEQLEQHDQRKQSERFRELIQRGNCVRIVCHMVDEELCQLLDTHEAVFAIQPVEGSDSHFIVDVKQFCSDDILRLMLEAGGSVVSMQQLSFDGLREEETICASH